MDADEKQHCAFKIVKAEFKTDSYKAGLTQVMSQARPDAKKQMQRQKEAQKRNGVTNSWSEIQDLLAQAPSDSKRDSKKQICKVATGSKGKTDGA